jgi:hypothetical protein
VPTVFVVGIILVVEPTPPVASVYHHSVFPVLADALNGTAVAFKQYVTLFAVGAFGVGLIVTTIAALPLSQAAPDDWLT